jgi:exosortase
MTQRPHESYSERLERNAYPTIRCALLLFFTAAAVLLAYWPFERLMSTGRSDYYSHILLIPFISAYFLFIERKSVLRETSYSWTTGLLLVLLGLAIYVTALLLRRSLSVNDFGSLATAGSIVLLWGGFLLAFGRIAFGAARFLLLFLIFAIPVPEFLLDGFIRMLQVGSTEVTQWLFDLTGTGYVRNGFEFQLAGINIEVAKECSGIRSSIALIITGVLVGHLFLKSGVNTAVLLIAMLPITIFKNAVRILTLSLLAIHVDTRFITDSFLHHSGGFIFFIPALGLMALVVWLLRKGEKGGKR